MNNKQLTIFLDELKTDVINAMQARGSDPGGQAASQITITADGDKAQLQIPGFMQMLETGRGPTSQGAATGTPPMIQRIKQWCRAKGIPDGEAWAIKKSIDKKGFKGKPGLLSQPLGNDNINHRLNPLLDVLTGTLIKELMEAIG